MSVTEETICIIGSQVKSYTSIASGGISITGSSVGKRSMQQLLPAGLPLSRAQPQHTCQHVFINNTFSAQQHHICWQHTRCHNDNITGYQLRRGDRDELATTQDLHLQDSTGVVKMLQQSSEHIATEQ